MVPELGSYALCLDVPIKVLVQSLDRVVRWYKEKRIKDSLGYLSPIEYRESLGLTT